MLSQSCVSPKIKSLVRSVLLPGGAVLFFSAARPLFAAFDYYSSETRPMGMGDAFTAVSDDPSAVAFNPAGLAQIDRPMLSTQFTQIVGGLESGESVETASLGFVAPVSKRSSSVASLAFQHYRADDLAREDVAAASFARVVSHVLSFPFFAGVTVKGMRREYREQSYFTNAVNNGGAVTSNRDPLFSGGRSKTVLGLDAGVLVRFGQSRRWSAGLASFNLNRPNVSLGSGSDPAPSAVRSGLAYRYGRGIVSSDIRTIRRASQSDTEGSLGLEHRVFSGKAPDFWVRFGYLRGSRDLEGWSTGFSIAMGFLRLDYGFLFRTGNLSDAAGGHRVGVLTRFGRPTRGAETAASANPPADSGRPRDPFASLDSAFRLVTGDLDRSRTLSRRDIGWIQALLHDKYPALKTVYSKEPSVRVKDPVQVFLNTVDPPERGFAEAAIRYWAEGNERYALHFLRRLSGPVLNTPSVSALYAIALAEVVHEAAAGGQIRDCYDEIRRLDLYFRRDDPLFSSFRNLTKETYHDSGNSI